MKKKRENRGENRSALEKWSDLLGSVSQLVIILAVVVVLVMFGRWLLYRNGRGPGSPAVRDMPVPEQTDWSQVDRKVAQIMEKARKKARNQAAVRLDAWNEQNMERVDNDFLDWYFSYWTQQEMGLKSLLYQVVHWVSSDTLTPVERITLQVQKEFAARVLRPRIAQMELERIVKETVEIYTGELTRELAKIPDRYRISPAEWERYTGDIAIISGEVRGGRKVSLSLKALAGVTAGGALVLFRMVRPLLIRAGSRVSVRLAGKSAAAMASKTGSGVAASMGGRLAGGIIAVGIIIWDVWDHFKTVHRARPLLRRNIADYFREMKNSLLDDPEFGVITVIRKLEQQAVKRTAAAE